MSEIYLQFTGTKSIYYTPLTFLRESLKKGFGRVVPFPLPCGTIVAFATYHPNPKIQGKKPDGKAWIFALGEVTGIHVQPKNENASLMWSYFLTRLQEENLIVRVSSTPRRIERECGSYTCSGGVYTSVDPVSFFKVCMEEWNKKNPDRKVSLSDFKWIITGRIFKHDNGGVIGIVDGVRPTRSFLKIRQTVEKDPAENIPLYEVVTVEKYNKGEGYSPRELLERTDRSFSSLLASE